MTKILLVSFIMVAPGCSHFKAVRALREAPSSPLFESPKQAEMELSEIEKQAIKESNLINILSNRR
jgi:hypothetical protein